MLRPAAVILAGGRGERLGTTIKANIEIGGVRLIERVLATLGDAEPVLVARGGFADADLRLPTGTTAVDDAGGGGPMAGVAGAIHWLSRRDAGHAFLLSVAVDTPFFPGDFLASALEQIGEADAVVARFDGQDYPTNTLWRVDAVTRHLAGATSLKSLLRRVRCVALDWGSRTTENPFDNVNTPADLAALKRRAEAHFGVGKGRQTR